MLDAMQDEKEELPEVLVLRVGLHPGSCGAKSASFGGGGSVGHGSCAWCRHEVACHCGLATDVAGSAAGGCLARLRGGGPQRRPRQT